MMPRPRTACFLKDRATPFVMARPACANACPFVGARHLSGNRAGDLFKKMSGFVRVRFDES
jgi:hypothetical protein